ncbi:hypothetical protein [uncultured Amphritea sp.]|uniref:hypothetical protein n=1 Tax=Amphritea sp. TaxID=1872502 RepID=UPI0025EB6AF9|nr:hypothetical protein [uncultured Amphritea sp.]
MEQQPFLVDELDKKQVCFGNLAEHKTLHRRLRYGSIGRPAILSSPVSHCISPLMLPT